MTSARGVHADCSGEGDPTTRPAGFPGEGRPAPRALPWQRDAHAAATTVDQRVTHIRCDAVHRALDLIHAGFVAEAAVLLYGATLQQAWLVGVRADEAVGS